MNPPSSPPPPSDPTGRPTPPGADPTLSDPYQPTVKATPTPTPSGPRPSSTPTVPDEVSKALPSARFGNFVRVQKLGAGGMGEVWKAWDDRLARWVALKFPRGGDEEEVARFQREAQTAGRLNHPNIAAIYEVGQDQGIPFIAMQYVEGQTLRAFPRNDRRALVRLVADAAQALQYAHEQGIVHRDLKPENLMVTTRSKPGRGEEHHVYVMDFGLARVTEGASNFSVSGLVVGTPSYMPPEQARGEKVDARADVYSLGATLYEILTERRPFQGANVYEVLKRVQEEDPKSPRKIDPRIAPDLETIVLKCLAKEPARRYASAQGLAEDLLAFDAGESIQARPEGITRRVWRKVRHNRLLSLAAAALLVAAAVVGYVAPRVRRDRRAAGLVLGINRHLEAREWKEAGGLIDELERLDAKAAAEAKAHRRRSLADSALERLKSGDLPRAKEAIDLLDPLDPPEAARLREEYRRRELAWRPLFSLAPPFDDLAAVFRTSDAAREGNSLFRRGTDGGSGPRVLTLKPSPAVAEIEAEFEPSWKAASRIGLALNATADRGYSFLLVPYEVPGSPRPPETPSFETVRRRGGWVALEILRDKAIIQERPAAASEVFRGRGPLRLHARREIDRLTFQVNDLEPVVIRDPFPLGSAQKGSFGLFWPAGVGLQRLQAGRKETPALANPLETGDALYVEGKVEEAREHYRKAEVEAVADDVRRQEAQYKQALCRLQVGPAADADAVRLLQQVSAESARLKPGADNPWPFLADCQLLRIHFRQPDKIDEAELTLAKLEGYGYKFDQLAFLFPWEVQWDILWKSHKVSTFERFLPRDAEETARRMRLIVQVSEVFEPLARRQDWRYHGLLRAYWMAGREDEALRVADGLFKKYVYPAGIVSDYSWILRLRGEQALAMDLVNRVIKESTRSLLVERARIHASLGEWGKARKDLESFFAEKSDYFDFSAASLLHGFVLEKLGEDPAAVRAAWKRGLAAEWRKEHPDQTRDPNAYLAAQGTPILYNWIMASMLGEMSDAEAKEIQSQLFAFSGQSPILMNIFQQIVKPSFLKGTWQSGGGREMARRIALRDIPFPEFAKAPAVYGAVSIVRETCMPGGSLDPDQEKLAVKTAEDFFLSHLLTGQLDFLLLSSFNSVMKNDPQRGKAGWEDIRARLKSAPRARGTLAYFFGQRYLKLGKPDGALSFFQGALQDALLEPKDDLLERLARIDLERLGPK